ncbi:MAG: carboxylating nicotinate-nucleotide diphosphorylase [Gaiellales bacterium]
MISAALHEDVGGGDVTTEAIVPEGMRATADLVVKAPGVVCGLEHAMEVFLRLDPAATMEVVLAEGSEVADPPAVAATVSASARAVLTGERTALNILQRMSGIATATRRYVRAVDGTGCRILDTRKTAPGLRVLDKHAVVCGGGANHRMGLDSAILIKDNHVALAGGIGAAVAAARAARPDLPVEVEVDGLDGLEQALAAGAETILLDNMDVAEVRRAVARTAGQAELEASGGVTLDTVAAIAATGVDAVSVGALTHSVTALDISLEVRQWQP